MSSKNTHSTHHSETKGQKIARSFLAFSLFIILTLLSLTACIRVEFINPKSITRVFSDDVYVGAFREDVLDYTHETLRRNMLPEDCLDNTITYEVLRDINYAYAAGITGATEEYNETAYQEMIKELEKEIASTTSSVIKNGGLAVDKNQKENGVAAFSEKIAEHIRKSVEKPYFNRVAEVLGIGKTVALVAIVLLAVMAVLLLLIVPSIGTKRYRALRYVAHAFNAAGLMDLGLVGGAVAVEHFKTLYIFPTYFRESVMAYVHRCELSVAVAALAMFLIALTVMVFVWKLNRDTKN